MSINITMPKTNDSFIKMVWELVENNVKAFNNAERDANPKPFSITDSEVMAELTEKERKEYQKAVKAREDANKIISDLKGSVRDRLAPVSMDTTEAKSAMRAAKSNIKGQLTTIKDYAEGKDLETVVSEIEKMINTLSPAVSTNKDSDASKIREWAKSQNIAINDRGKISDDVKAAYYAGHSK